MSKKFARSVRETLKDEPEWMTGLSKYPELLSIRRATDFGKPVGR
ncbi:MAG TPA: hypothetical protein VHT96_07435 [Clostridia bacterium]|nr:hypothetical protein [Clostridia bacterium]